MSKKIKIADAPENIENAPVMVEGGVEYRPITVGSRGEVYLQTNPGGIVHHTFGLNLQDAPLERAAYNNRITEHVGRGTVTAVFANFYWVELD